VTHDEPDVPAGLAGLLGRNARALVAGGVSTYAVIVAAGLSASGSEGGVGAEVLVALAAAAVWVSIAAPLLAARGRSVLETLLRGGVVIDAAGLALLTVAAVLTLQGQADFSLLAALQAYCVLLALGLAQLAVVSLGRSQPVRFSLAILSASAAMAMLATPFWIEGALGRANAEGSLEIAAFAMLWNPFYSLAAGVRYAWNYAGWMYTFTGIGENVPPPTVHWYSAAVRYAALAAVAWTAVPAVWAVRRSLGRGARGGSVA
jgi:hypothetical protein